MLVRLPLPFGHLPLRGRLMLSYFAAALAACFFSAQLRNVTQSGLAMKMDE